MLKEQHSEIPDHDSSPPATLEARSGLELQWLINDPDSNEVQLSMPTINPQRRLLRARKREVLVGAHE